MLRHCICKRSIGPELLGVRDNHNRTNNVLERDHSVVRRRMEVSHLNLYTFLGHLQHATCDQMNDVQLASATV